MSKAFSPPTPLADAEEAILATRRSRHQRRCLNGLEDGPILAEKGEADGDGAEDTRLATVNDGGSRDNSNSENMPVVEMEHFQKG
jgi:hypothetical protein